MTDYYRDAHLAVLRQYGKAKTHACAHCGRPARDWALMHDSAQGPLDFERRGLFSLNVDDYTPLCVRCHRAFDADQRRTEAFATARAEFARRFAEDPEFAKQQRVYLALGTPALIRRYAEDPEFAKRQREHMVGLARVNNAKQRACSECGLVSTPGGIGAHQKHTGHSGWTVVKEQS